MKLLFPEENRLGNIVLKDALLKKSYLLALTVPWSTFNIHGTFTLHKTRRFFIVEKGTQVRLHCCWEWNQRGVGSRNTKIPLLTLQWRWASAIWPAIVCVCFLTAYWKYFYPVQFLLPFLSNSFCLGGGIELPISWVWNLRGAGNSNVV